MEIVPYLVVQCYRIYYKDTPVSECFSPTQNENLSQSQAFPFSYSVIVDTGAVFLKEKPH